MRKGITVEVTETDRRRLAAIVVDRKSPQKHLWRAQVVLLTADGCGAMEIMRRTGASKTAVWHWQERFMKQSVPGLLRDKTRPSRIPALATGIKARIVAATQVAPTAAATR